MPDQERSRDTLFDGELHCLQHVNGYRFSIDPVLLAHFVRPGKEENILDLGAGCGVLGFILLYRFRDCISSLTAFELQTGLAQLTRDNIRLNRFQKQMGVVEGDLRDFRHYLEPESFSTVVCNPPFYPAGTGRKSRNKESEIARHQVAGTLTEILAASAMAVKNRGKVYLVYPAESVGTLLALLEQRCLIVKRMQMVYSYPDSVMGARLVLIEAVKNGGEGMKVLPPLYIYAQKDGDYSEVVQGYYDANDRCTQ